MMAMKTAVARGVRVRLLVPEQPDHHLIGLACRTYYEELLEAGVALYVYQRGLLHAKEMTVDGRWAVLGAANLDIRSFRVNFEVCTVVYSEATAQRLTQQFETDLQQSTALTLADLRKRSFALRTAQRAARLLSPLL
jgi:phosphatidylserine/phosphatidylglycerophosphate/cardiolipin synthase-like enzyme